MNVNQIKTIFLVLAAIARGTHAGCLVSEESLFGNPCALSDLNGDCCTYGSCDVGGSGECRHPLDEFCDADYSDQCFLGKFGSIFHMICISRYLVAAPA